MIRNFAPSLALSFLELVGYPRFACCCWPAICLLFIPHSSVLCIHCYINMEGRGTPPHAQQGNNDDPPPRRSPRINAQEREPVLAAVVAPGRGGVDGAGRTGRGRGGRGGRAAPGRRAAPGHAPGRGGGRAGSDPRFNRTELEHLNEIVERILPIGPDEWEAVTMQHSDLYPTHNRCMANLKRKF